MSDKPHLMLDWIFDIPNNKLTCKINEELSYEALEGGTKGYTKTYQGTTSHITSTEWAQEKVYISDLFGETLGYYQFDPTREQVHPDQGWIENCSFGIGRDGRYLDHMQRPQILLEGLDCAHIGFGQVEKNIYSTPDKGKTIFKRIRTQDVYYRAFDQEEIGPDDWWYEHPQACAMQPRTSGYRLSSYDEMINDGIPAADVEKCRNLEWDDPRHPELQRFYIYPTS